MIEESKVGKNIFFEKRINEGIWNEKEEIEGDWNEKGWFSILKIKSVQLSIKVYEVTISKSEFYLSSSLIEIVNGVSNSSKYFTIR
jgi:hypothetical protein